MTDNAGLAPARRVDPRNELGANGGPVKQCQAQISRAGLIDRQIDAAVEVILVAGRRPCRPRLQRLGPERLLRRRDRDSAFVTPIPHY